MAKTEIFKNVPSVEGLRINHDGTVIYYKDKLRRVSYRVDKGKKYRILRLKEKRYSVSRLVFEAFNGPLHKARKIIYNDGNADNLNYRNLRPRYFGNKLTPRMRKVPGFDDLYVNDNGSMVIQYGFEICLSVHRSAKGYLKYPTAHILMGQRYGLIHICILVAKAFLGYKGNGKIVHRDENTFNNHFENLETFTLREFGLGNLENLAKARLLSPPKVCAVPQSDTETVKQKLLDGESLKSIAKKYGCTDMSISRFKKRHLTKEQIDKINKTKNVNTTHTHPKRSLKR